MVRVRANESVSLAVAKRIAMAKRINTQNKGGETLNPPTQREIGGGETLNPSSPREIGGETLNPPSQKEIGRGETPKPPSPREIVGGGTPNPPAPSGSKSSVSIAKAKRKWTKTLNEGGETSNHPPLQKETGGKISKPPLFKTAMARKRRKTQNGKGETSSPPPPPPLDWRREFDSYISKIEGGKISNPPSQNEIVGKETLNTPSPRGSESSVSIAKANTKWRKTQNEGGETLNIPPHKETGGGVTLSPPSQREIVGGETLNSPSPREVSGGETLNQTQTEIRGEETSNPLSPREIVGGETSNSSPPREETGGGIETITINTELLDCSICTNPLCPPIYQCMNGHVACPSCWSKLQHKCHICNTPVVTRNIALEAVLESVHLSCPNANFGCRQSVSYSQMQLHTDTCEFGPFLCPIPGCSHKAFSGEWRGHFLKDHRDTVPHFWDMDSHYNYGESYTISFEGDDLKEDRYYTFLGPGKDVFLFVKEPIPNVGNAHSIYYIDLPDLGQNYYESKLRVQGKPYLSSSLQSESQVVSIKEWKRGEVHGSSLLVQSQFFWERYMKVDVLINKKKW